MSREDDTGAPTWVHLLAVALELAIVQRLLVYGDFWGLTLCAFYAWWSATWAMCMRLLHGFLHGGPK